MACFLRLLVVICERRRDDCRQTKLDEALLSSGRVSDALHALMQWLSKAESFLTEDQPTLGDLDTVSMLLEQHKVLLLSKVKYTSICVAHRRN